MECVAALSTEGRLASKLGSFLLLLQWGYQGGSGPGSRYSGFRFGFPWGGDQRREKLQRLACELWNQISIYAALVEALVEPKRAGPPLSHL